MDINSIASGIGLAKVGYDALNFIKAIAGSDVISGYFKFDCNLVDGSDKIKVDLIRDQKNKDVWWYWVHPIDDYVFVRTPVVESCAHELAGHVVGEAQPDARYWRWVAPTLPGRIYGGDAANLKVDFLIYGYKPKALIQYFSNR